MQTISLRRLTAFVCGAVLSSSVILAPAHAQPVVDHNVGSWIDLLNDSSGMAPAASSIAGKPGQAGVTRDPIARLVTLNTGAAAGYWFTTEISPSSFKEWKTLTLDYSASAADQVQVEVYDVTNFPSTTLYGPYLLGPSGTVSLAGVSPSAKKLRVRVLLTKDPGNPAHLAPPTVTSIKATWDPQSVLQVAIESPATSDSGNTIQVRLPVSISYVNATEYVAYVNNSAVINNTLYHQLADLSYESSTLNGQWTASAITVRGVLVPARSVYWSLTSQQAGKTYAYYANFRSPNGLARELGYQFKGAVYASNATTVATGTVTTLIEAHARTSFFKSAGNTFVIGGEHYAEPGTTITLTVSPTNWWNQTIPYGAQTHFQPVVWDSFDDFLVKGVAVYSGIHPPVGAGITPQGQTKLVRGITVPKNSVYWEVADMPPGQRLDLSYTIDILGGATRGTRVNDCSPPPAQLPPEAGLKTPQASILPAAVHDCAFDDSQSESSCVPRAGCLPLNIGVQPTIGYGFSKGDEINGSVAIRGGNFDDNPLGFVVWGQPITYKMAVGNSGIARLDHVVAYDFVKYGWSLVSASVPTGDDPLPANQAKVYYWHGGVIDCGGPAGPDEADCTEPPSFYTNAAFARDANWKLTRPATVTWVAYEIPKLRSSYCRGVDTDIVHDCAATDPTSVIMDFTVLPSAQDECVEARMENVGYVRIHSARDLAGGEQLGDGWENPLPGQDTEWVNVRQLRPDLSTSVGTGSGSVIPGHQATHEINVQNRSNVGNPIDNALNVTATVTVPHVIVNGVSTLLPVVAYSADSPTSVTGLGTGTIVVKWATMAPNTTRKLSLTYQVPVGIRNAESFSTVANITGKDNQCEPDATARVIFQTSVASAPSLIVDKDLDYRVVDPGRSVSYTLTAFNDGTSPSTGTWMIDRIDDLTTFVSVTPPEGGQVWFSNEGPEAGAPFPGYYPNNPLTGGLPNALVADFHFSDAVIRQHFKPGREVPGQSDTYEPNVDPNALPTPPTHRWVAILMDAAVDGGEPGQPDIFPAGIPKTATIKVEVPDDDELIGQLVENEPAIVSNELLQTIGNRVEFIISNDPGLGVAKMCPAVIGNGDVFTYEVNIHNDTTNDDELVTVVDTLPAGFVPELSDAYDPDPVDVEEVDGRTKVTWLLSDLPGESIDDIQTVRVTGHFEGQVTGHTVRNQVIASAQNADGLELSFFDDCPSLIMNTDVEMVKLVDNKDPRSGDIVTYTLQVINHMQRPAEGVNVSDVLPDGVTVVTPIPGDVFSAFTILTPGWQFVGHGGGSSSFGLGLVRDGYAPRVFPTGTVAIQFQALVDFTVPKGTKLTNTATVTTTTGQECRPAVYPDICDSPPCDPTTPAELPVCQGTCPPDPLKCTGRPDTDTEDVTTPLPDLKVSISAPPFVKPGDVTTWTIEYSNIKPEDAQHSVVFFSFPDGPTIPASPDPLPNATPNKADFTLTSVLAPPGTVVYYSTNDLDDRPDFDPLAPPGSDWIPYTTPPAAGVVVNHLAFHVTHCGDDAIPCNLGDIHRLEGPFFIRVKTEARRPDGTLPAIGGTFNGCADIAMIDAAYPEADAGATPPLANNHSCTDVKTPGVGLKVEALCKPDGGYPGILPGDTTTFSFSFENTGTVPAYNIRFAVDIDPTKLEVLYDDADTGTVVELTPATGPGAPTGVTTVPPVDGSGVRTLVPVKFVRSYDQIWVGPVPQPNTPEAPVFGLAPGDRGTFTVTARVRDDVADSTPTSSEVTGTIEGRAGDFLEVGTALADNKDSCGPTVYRADVFVIKSITNATDPEKPYADGGDTLNVQVQYGNLGHYAASDVIMTDHLVDGITFQHGSVQHVPVGAFVEYEDDSGAWSLVAPADVHGVRIRYDDNTTMAAPANSVFSQTSVPDFNLGRYNGTYGNEQYQAVSLNPGDVDFCRSENNCGTGEIIRNPKELEQPVKNTHSCKEGNYLPEGQCCQACCPNADEMKICEAASKCQETHTCFADLYAAYRECQRSGADCVEPVDPCEPAECKGDLVCFGGGEKFVEPSSCAEQGNNGYYQPDRLCNRQCCPPTDPESFRKWSDYCHTTSQPALNEAWNKCRNSERSDCGPPPDLKCDEMPAECGGGVPQGSGRYYSPVFPGEDEGNVLDWGLLIVNATFGEDANESIWVDVFIGTDDNETAIRSYPLDDGTKTYTFDLNQPYGDEPPIDPSLFPNLRVRARMSTGSEGSCMEDIVPTVEDFWGFPMGLNQSDVVIGFQRGNNTYDPSEGQNLTAFAWTPDDEGVTDLHAFLPIKGAVGLAPSGGKGSDTTLYWEQSVASDINDTNGTIAGWADPKPGQGYNIPDDCQRPVDTYFYAPPESEDEDTHGGTDSVAYGRHFQWVVPSSQLPSSTTITAFRLRDRSYYFGVKDISNVTVQIGYTGDAANTSLDETFSANWNSGSPEWSWEGLYLEWTHGFLQDGSPNPFDFEVELPSPFDYDSSQGSVLIDLTWNYDGDPTDDQLVLENLWNCTADENTTMMSWSPEHETADNFGDCPLSTQIVAKGAEPFEVPIAWRQTTEPNDYVAYCLPWPHEDNVTIPYGDDLPTFPGNSLVYVNEAGYLAASAGAVRLNGSSAAHSAPVESLPKAAPTENAATLGSSAYGPLTPFGVPTVYHYVERALGYLAFPIMVERDGELELARAAAVTGLGDDNASTVIGVGATHYPGGCTSGCIGGKCGGVVICTLESWSFAAYAWGMIDVDGLGRPHQWNETNLNDVLENSAAFDAFAQYWWGAEHVEIALDEVAPLDIDEHGNIVGVFTVDYSYGDSGATELGEGNNQFTVIWMRNENGEYDPADVVLPLPPQLGGTFPQLFAEGGSEFSMVFMATNSINDGRSYLSSIDYDAQSVDAWSFKDGELTSRSSGSPSDLILGSRGTTALGITTQGFPRPWANFDGEVVGLGYVNKYGFHIPLHTNDSRTVIGAYLTEDELGEGTRVFIWHGCSETPRLDDWKVTYLTDKNPAWDFQVDVDDICQSNIFNQVDITTSTPEIEPVKNNTSNASISVNTADLAAHMFLYNTVVAPGEYVTGEAMVENLGPGTARDVDIAITLPEGCVVDNGGYFGSGSDGTEVYFLSADLLANTAHFIAPKMDMTTDDDPTQVGFWFSCQNTIDEAGLTLSASISVTSPTIDCNPGNDASTEGVLIGNYPNLWVDLAGPGSTTVNNPTSYLVTFGNNGNEDTNGTIELTLPPGASFQFVCPQGEGNGNGFAASIADDCVPCEIDGQAMVTIDQTTPGKVVFVPHEDGFWGATGQRPLFYCEVPFELVWGTCEQAGDELEFVATALPDRPDADVSDNAAATQTLVLAPAADLKLWVDRSESTVEDGKEVLYTFHYANVGTKAAFNTTLAVTVPDSLFIKAIGPHTASINAHDVTFNVGRGSGFTKSLGPNESGAVTIRAIVSGTGTASPTVATLSAASGACPVSIPVTAPLGVPADTGLHVLVSPSTGSACGRDQSIVTWTVTVTNPSNSDARGTQVSVTVPDGLVYVPGSILGANGVDVRAPDLAWSTDIPARGVRSFEFKTSVVATDIDLIALEATAGQVTGSGSLPINCGKRVVVTKSWDLTATCMGDDFAIQVTVKNLTANPVSGILYDTFQTDAVPSEALDDPGTRNITFPVLNLMPGEEITFEYSVEIGDPLVGGHPLFDRAVFDSLSTVQAASNLVAGAVSECGPDTHCTLYSCETFDGCLGSFNANHGPELCGNTTDDDCDGNLSNGFELIGEPCDAVEAAPDTDLCLNDVIACAPSGITTQCNPVTFAIDVCDGLDNNCDGVADEPYKLAPFNLGKKCDGTDGDLCTDGVMVCNGPTATICDDDAASTAEKCNGRDDDCDGQTDEDWPELGDACDGSNDADFCKKGKIECNITFTGTVCLEKDLGVDEICNGVDDTCFCDRPGAPVPCTPPASEIDEGFNLGNECMTADEGLCRVAGLLACNASDASHQSTLCVAITPVTPKPEVCDGLDNNCDGAIDNGPTSGTSVCKDLETDILTGPPAITSSTTATFTYVNPLANPVLSHTTFECRLDNEDWVVCNHEGPTPSLTYTGLTPGPHTLLVRATRGDDEVDPTPDIWTWVIDTRIPDTVIVVKPPDPSPNPGGTFVFDSPTPNPDHYMCVLDPAPGTIDAATGCPVNGHASYKLCSPPVPYQYSGLADGSHTICVYVVDTKGDVDPIPATYTWVIDTQPPETEITSGPPTVVQVGTGATFVYDDPDNKDAITFECSLDGATWTRCDGTVVGDGGTIDYDAGDLPVGQHTFRVRTCDFTKPAEIQCDPTPAEYTWEVTTPCPNERNLTLSCDDSLTIEADADKCGWSGVTEALATDGCSAEVTVTRDDTYKIGDSPILYTASNDAGQTAECTTILTVLDVTDPVVICGTPVGTLPSVIQATATDACGTVITIENVVCSRVVDGVTTPVELADCPVTIDGDTISITGRLTEGELTLTYDAHAVDPSGNSAVVPCNEGYQPDKDHDGIIDAEDNCVETVNGDQKDADGDGIGDSCDVCPDVSDPGQADRDDDGIGDACSDKDKDTILDIDDNCEVKPNTDQLDSDLDGQGDICDEAPFDGLSAEGDGGCSGGAGAGGILGGLLGLAGLVTAVRQRRRG